MEDREIDLIPLHSRVIIRKKGAPTSIGKIIVPENCKEVEPNEGTVVAKGPECFSVDVGEEVYYGKYSGFTFERNGKAYIFCNEEDVLAVVKGA